MACCAVAVPVTATSSGQPKYCWVAWARGGPTNSRRSPNLSARCANPASIGPVQVPDGLEILAARDDLAFGHGRDRAAVGGHPLRVVQVHALRSLQEHEVLERGLAERQQRQVHAGRVVGGGMREVRPGQVRGAADGGQQVLHQGQVQHLLGGDVADVLAPALDRLRLFGAQALGFGLLQRERGVQVLAHDAVLEFGRLAQHVVQRLAVLDHQRRLGRGQPAARRDHLCEPSPGLVFAHVGYCVRGSRARGAVGVALWTNSPPGYRRPRSWKRAVSRPGRRG